MKTIYTSLPIYNRLVKQWYERGKKGGEDVPVPIICPRHRLPSFQWLDNGDNATTVSKIELIDFAGESYNATTPFTGWTNAGWDVSFTSSGLNFSGSETAGHTAIASINGIYYGITGEVIRFHTIATISAGTPVLNVYENGVNVANYNITSGVNNITHTLTADGTYVGGGLMFMITSDFAAAQTLVITDTEITIDSINSYFVTMPDSHAITGDKYFTYDGDTLNYLLPQGVYYLKITMNNGRVYYSDWFKVDCVYENLISAWTNNGYNTFTSSGTSITFAQELAANGNAYSTSFSCEAGETIKIIFYLTAISGTRPTLVFTDTGYTAPQTHSTVAGLNEISFTTTLATTYEIQFTNGSAGAFMVSAVWVQKSYSDKYLILDFSNSCDLGDILYHDGFTQTLWFESEPMEMAFPTEEEVLKDGNAKQVRVFARQVKKYVIRTNKMPGFMSDVFNRMKLHDTVELTDLVGDQNEVYNLDVEYEWLNTDKYYANFVLTFDYDEAFVIGGCCNNM